MPTPSHCDPTRGVFETLLVAGGRPVELEAHLERLAASLATLYDAELPAEARGLAYQSTAGLPLGRLRLIASRKEGGSLNLTAAADPLRPVQVLPRGRKRLRLWSFDVPGGFGGHKWVDRRLLERAETEAPDDAVPLLVDAGSALEGARANVFAVEDGALLTPPTDGRIVPGITRQRVLDLAAAAGRNVREEPLSLERLRGCDEVFLTNSVRGVEPVGSLDGSDLRDGGPLSAALAAELRRDWLGRAERAAVAAVAP